MTDEREIQVVDNAAMSHVVVAEIEQQVATARRYPRSISRFLKEAETMATVSQQVADDCTYVLPRKDKSGQTRNIEGPSARFAEIVASAWGNCRAAARIVSEDGEFVVAQGAFHDLERNVAITCEVRRRITDRSGRRFSADMIAVTGNAAASIALRNAVFKGVPKAYWQTAHEAARRVSLGDSKTLATRRSEALQYLSKFGATEQQVLQLLGVKSIEDVTIEHLGTLKGLATALRDGDTTVEQAFAPQEPAVVVVAASVQQPQEIAPKPPAEPINQPAATSQQAQASLVLPWQVHQLPPNALLPVGTKKVTDLMADIVEWNGKEWQTCDQAQAHDDVVAQCRKQLMSFFKVRRMDRAQAMAWCCKQTNRADSIKTLNDLHFAQLLECVRAVDEGDG